MIKIIKIHSRYAWIYLKEKRFFVPDLPDEELGPTITDFLNLLSLFDAKFIRLSFWMIKSGEGVYPLDFYVSGILSRSLSLIYGFENLINSKNYIAAVHLVRPHLDNFMRLNAAWLVDKPHEFASKVWKGEQINKMKDREGKVMKDSYLKDKATEKYAWMKNVYEETSGFIHFSNKHINNTITSIKEDDYSVLTTIGRTDNFVSNKNKLESIMCMVETCNAISESVFGWIDTKRLKG